MAAASNTAVPDGAATGSRPIDGERAVLEYVGEVVMGAAILLSEVPVVGAVCKTFLSFARLAETAASNKEELQNLRDLCDLVVKSVLRRTPDNLVVRNGFEQLKNHVRKAKEIADRCNGRGFPGTC